MFHLFWVVLPALRLQNYDCFWLKWCSRTTLKGSLSLAALFYSSLTRKGPTPKALNVTAKPKAATSCHWAGLAQCCHPHLSIPVPFEAWDMLQVINTFLMPPRILLLSRTAPSTSPTSVVLLSSAQGYGRCKLLFMHISKHTSPHPLWIHFWGKGVMPTPIRMISQLPSELPMCTFSWSSGKLQPQGYDKVQSGEPLEESQG